MGEGPTTPPCKTHTSFEPLKEASERNDERETTSLSILLSSYQVVFLAVSDQCSKGTGHLQVVLTLRIHGSLPPFPIVYLRGVVLSHRDNKLTSVLPLTFK